MNETRYMKLLGWMIVILLIALLSGCATSQPWETADVSCLQNANAACIAAMRDGKAAGIIHCQPPGWRSRHAVTWVYYEGRQHFYDPSFGKYLDLETLGRIFRVTEGPSRGVFETFPNPPMPDLEKLILKPTRPWSEW